MYKILIISLFAFLIADESTIYLTTEGWEKSDKLKDVLKNLKPDMDEFNNKVSMLLHPDKFIVKNAFKIIDTTKIENTINDSLINKIIKLENNYYEGLDSEKIFSFYKLSDSGDYYEILRTWYAIEINVDKSIKLDNQIKDMVWMALESATGLEKELDPDLLIFNSVDIQKEKNSNKIVSLNRNDIYDDSWAVIIGINKYENLSNLDYAVADAQAVKDMLISKFDYPEQNVKLLINEEANKANIVNVISDVSLKAGEDDRIIVFYAGHGETMSLPDGGEMGYLVPIDGRQENLYASAIPMDDLKRLSNMSKAKHMLFLVDACYGGLAAAGSRSLEPTKTPNYIEKITNLKSRQIITAGGKDEKVFEKSEWGHSAYTKNLLSALEDGYADSNGDGYITADELGDYLSEKVSIDSENQQTPQSRRLTSHEGEFVFFKHKQFSKRVSRISDSSQHNAKIHNRINTSPKQKRQKFNYGISYNIYWISWEEYFPSYQYIGHIYNRYTINISGEKPLAKNDLFFNPEIYFGFIGNTTEDWLPNNEVISSGGFTIGILSNLSYKMMIDNKSNMKLGGGVEFVLLNSNGKNTGKQFASSYSYYAEPWVEFIAGLNVEAGYAIKFDNYATSLSIRSIILGLQSNTTDSAWDTYESPSSISINFKIYN